MPEQRHAFRLGRSLVVALPPQVLEHLGVARGMAVYWHLARGGEAVLTVRPRRTGGHPEGMALQRQLVAAEAELVRLRRRNEARDRTLYAEGWNAGAVTAQERMLNPHGPSADRARRRRLYRYVFPAAAAGEARPGRARRRRVETVPGPDTLPSPSPSPEVASSEGEALAPGPSVPGQPMSS